MRAGRRVQRCASGRAGWRVCLFGGFGRPGRSAVAGGRDRSIDRLLALLLVCGDWCMNGKVEGGFLSAKDAVNKLLKYI